MMKSILICLFCSITMSFSQTLSGVCYSGPPFICNFADVYLWPGTVTSFATNDTCTIVNIVSAYFNQPMAYWNIANPFSNFTAYPGSITIVDNSYFTVGSYTTFSVYGDGHFQLYPGHQLTTYTHVDFDLYGQLLYGVGATSPFQDWSFFSVYPFSSVVIGNNAQWSLGIGSIVNIVEHCTVDIEGSFVTQENFGFTVVDFSSFSTGQGSSLTTDKDATILLQQRASFTMGTHSTLRVLGIFGNPSLTVGTNAVFILDANANCAIMSPTVIPDFTIFELPLKATSASATAGATEDNNMIVCGSSSVELDRLVEYHTQAKLGLKKLRG